MVVINKKEKDIIRERFPDVHIVRTMKQHSQRHRYYVEETKSVMRLLNALRYPKTNQKEGTDYPDRKKRKRNSAAVS